LPGPGPSCVCGTEHAGAQNEWMGCEVDEVQYMCFFSNCPGIIIMNDSAAERGIEKRVDVCGGRRDTAVQHGYESGTMACFPQTSFPCRHVLRGTDQSATGGRRDAIVAFTRLGIRG
jgi:hypothetical protein